MAAIDPNWIIAGVTAVGAGVGAWRVATKALERRRERQDDYERLHCDIYGWPAEEDDYGNQVAAPRPGAMDRIEKLEQRKA